MERTVEELLLPALEVAVERTGRAAEHEFGCRWATGWLHAARRVVPPPMRAEGVLIFDSCAELGTETLHVQALELAVRRAGFRALLLSVALEQDRLVRAIRGSDPAVIVLAGDGATLDVVGRLVYSARHARSGARVVEYRHATPVSGKHAVHALGMQPSEAVVELRRLVKSPPAERPAEPARAAAAGRPASLPAAGGVRLSS
jgi:hypothetical protein